LVDAARYGIVFFAFTSLLASGCVKHAPTPSAPATPANVYVAEQMGNNAVLWNNGSTSYLSDIANGPSNARAVLVSANNVYVCGFEYDSRGNRLATIWDNGVAASLPSPTSNSTISAIFVSGNDIYAIGIGYNSFNGPIYLLYWKNEVATILDSNVAAGNILDNPAALNCIYVSDSNVYIGGNNHTNACYWVNGMVTNLNAYSTCTSLVVFGSDVYAVSNQTVNGISVPTYWKNGTPVVLTYPSNSNTYAQSIFVSGSDVYVAGEESNNGNSNSSFAVWQNGVLLPTKGTQNDTAYVESIQVSGQDVYVAGAEKINGAFVSVYWKNGLAIPLSLTNSWANSIF
jgi:hypothetical protein